jgi:hypothetical protein
MSDKFAFHFNLAEPRSELEWFRATYEHFLQFEHTTSYKELWLEQKKIYDEIFHAPDPLAALREFRKLGKTTSAVAYGRLLERNAIKH